MIRQFYSLVWLLGLEEQGKSWKLEAIFPLEKFGKQILS